MSSTLHRFLVSLYRLCRLRLTGLRSLWCRAFGATLSGVKFDESWWELGSHTPCSNSHPNLQAPTRIVAALLGSYVHVQIMIAAILLSKCLTVRYFSRSGCKNLKSNVSGILKSKSKSQNWLARPPPVRRWPEGVLRRGLYLRSCKQLRTIAH